MAGLHISRRSTSERHISPWGVTLIVVGVALLALGQNVTLTLLVGLLLVPPTVLVLMVVWRRLLPHRATKVLKDLGASNREGKGPKLRRLWRRGSVWYLAWKMPTGVTVSALTKRREAVEQALDASCEFWYDRGLFHMRAGVHKVPGRVKFEDFYRTPAPAGELVVGIGLSREGPLWADLTKVLHVLNGGQTDRGKSSWTRQALTWLALRYGPEHVRFALIDLKGGLELNVAERLPHMWRPVARELESCVETMRAVMAELERRQVLFDLARVENIQRWNQANAGERLPYVVVVVDEIAELSAVESADRTAQALRQEALSAVSSLTRLGRATGFHVIVTTQRPDAKVVPGQIKANMPATVAFRVRANVNSEILLGEANYAAAALPPDVKGRAIWQWDRETEFQAVYLAKEEAETLLERAYPRVLTGVEAGTVSVSPCPICPSVEEVLSS